MAQINLGSIKFNWKGSYSGATAYVVDDVVESSGSSYICILATTGNAPPNATYWEQMSSAGTNGTDGTDLGTTLTTQGDIVYRDASGLQRLPIGTANQILQVNSGATALEYTAKPQGKIAQFLFAFDSTQRTTTSTSYTTASNTLNINITPTSASSKILYVASFTGGFQTANARAHYTMFRDSTNLGTANGLQTFEENTNYSIENEITLIAIDDSHNSTSPLAYTVQVKNQTSGANSYITTSNTKSFSYIMEII